MKKITLLKSLLVVMALSLFSFSVVAEEVISNTFSSTTMQTGISAYDKTWDNVSGTTLTLANFNNNQKQWAYVKCGRNGKASVGTITTKSALAEKVTKVVVTVDNVLDATKVNSTYLEVATDANFTQNVQKVTVTIAKGALTYAVPTPTQNCFYRLTYDCASHNKNGIVQISKVDFYYTTDDVENIEATAIALDKTTLSVEQYKTAQLTATLEPANATTLVTWTSSNENVATVVNGLVSAVGVGETTITATAGELTATCAVTVTEPVTISAAEAVEIANTNGTTAVGPYVVRGYVTRIEDEYSSQYGNITFWIADSKNGDDVFNLYRVAPVVEADQAVKVGDYIQAVGMIKLYSSKPQMLQGGQYTIIEDPNPEVEATAIVLNKATVSLEQYREEKLVATLTPAGATTQIVWTSSNEEVATVENGLVKAVGVGEATITATAGEFTATCDVTVSEATVLTCAEAAEMALTVSGNNVNYEGGQYVVNGYVTEIATAYSKEHNNISVWVADTKEGGNVLQLYRAKPVDGVIPEVGDYVVAIGYLIKHYDTPEMAAGCVCTVVPAKPVIAIDAATATATITCETEGATVKYAMLAQGEEVTEEAYQEIGEPVELNKVEGVYVIYAYAVIGDVKSEVAEATYTYENGQVAVDAEMVTITDVYVQNNTIVAEGEFEIFTITGQNVTDMNGSLTRGAYIVRTAEGVAKVIVR